MYLLKVLNKPLFLFFVIVSICLGCDVQSNQNRVNQPIVMDFEIDMSSETAQQNPFMNYRLQVLFEKEDQKHSVPGFYAADGKAAQTSASSGGKWRVIFTPNQPGEWNYRVSFKKGERIAVSEDLLSGSPVKPYDEKTGKLHVRKVYEKAEDFEKSGRLTYNGTRYLHTEDGNIFLKFGTNSPENFLAYGDIDGSYSYDPNKDFLKSWTPHLEDWNPGDPTWQNGKGKGIIGALNYLASKGMNSVYALTMNIEGDSRDVWPFLSHEKKDFQRYDVSKLAQWDIIFSHAEDLGIVMHLITQEKENELVLDDGNMLDTRKLYYRELIARFGYHKNIIWNIGEENGNAPNFWPQGQNDQQRFAMMRYLKDHDPYQNPVVIHTLPDRHDRDPILKPLLKFDRLDGLSMQISDVYKIYPDINQWVKESAKMERPWIVMMDEIGPWHTGTNTDTIDPKHDTLRVEVLWSTLMAGGAGVEWYFGWHKSPNDLNAEDWRSRNNMWEQSDIAHEFFKELPLTKMNENNILLSKSGNYCLANPGDVYALYLKNGGPIHLNLDEYTDKFKVSWFNPRNGQWSRDSIEYVQGGGVAYLGKPQTEPEMDWAVLVKKE